MGFKIRFSVLVLTTGLLLVAGSLGASIGEKTPEKVDCKQELKVLGIGNQTISARLAQECYLEFTPRFYDEDSDRDIVGEKINATRFVLPRLSRFEDLKSFFKSLRLVVRVASKRGRKNLPSFCLHKNESAPLGHCPTKWREPDSKSETWQGEKSPFEKNLLEIRWPEGEDPRDIYVSVIRETDQHRVIWLVVGLVLMPLADTLSKIVVLYYGVGMSVGVLLVVGILVFQLMKLLPLTRGSSARVVFAGAVMGMGGLLVTWLSGLATEAAESIGFGDNFVNPLVVLGVCLIVLIGAAMGFWFVRKLVVLPSGELDPATIVFVRWALWVFAAALLIMSSADAVLGAVALSVGVLLALLVSYAPSLRKKLGKPARLRTAVRQRDGEDALDEADFPGTPVREASRTRSFSPGAEHEMFRPNLESSAGPQGAPGSEFGNTPVLKQAFVSSYHHINGRRLMTPQAVASVSKDATRAALADLVKSQDFGAWASTNLNRLIILPGDKREQRTFSEIASTAWMEEGPQEEED